MGTRGDAQEKRKGGRENTIRTQERKIRNRQWQKDRKKGDQTELAGEPKKMTHEKDATDAFALT